MVDRFQPDKAWLPAVVILALLLAAMLFFPFGVMVGILIPVPLIFIYVQWGRRVGVVLLALVFGVLFTLMGPKQAILFFTEYAVLVAVMAETIRLQLPFDKCILLSTLASAALSLVLLFFIFTDRESTLTEFFQKQIDGHFEQSLEALREMGDKPEDLKAMEAFAEKASGALAQSYPAFITIGTFITALINYYMVRFFWGRVFGPGLFHPARFSEWVVPDPTVWVFIGSGGLFFFFGESLGALGMNLFFLVLVVYFFQGLAILIHFLESRNVPLFFWVLIFFVIVIQPLLIGAAIGLGIFDIWIDFRKIRKNPEEISE
ncbi:hypothetical protein UR09_04495 [Candidatus Nitromaritima sp. SCGC AAA799-A02]|nr:hypothetical protein UR09_04495 [Candidatus Nitromaritima sp. SCGC AAA799-A02]KMP12365.1 hypothetical protein UZ36_01280 [Candidatus Nitromaritima sp. SCGC AAA799-C22]